MEQRFRKIPIGIQSFSKIIKDQYLYVDKTEYIYKLVHASGSYFLSRPRRFGKSLFLSTLKEYWLGNKELFHRLKIEALEADNKSAWQPYPVFYFDFNRDNYSTHSSIENVLNAHLVKWEAEYECAQPDHSLALRFQHLIELSYKKYSKRCVILVDEYDKPLLDTISNPELNDHNRAVFKGFFSTLKSFDEFIEFVFITGVTKFSKVSLFSDLNQLRDISLNKEYASICGITEAEMKAVFLPEIETMAAAQNLSVQDCMLKLKQTYDGYHFYQDTEGVYNPFSLLYALADQDFQSYWFATGTPTFLIKQLKEIGFEVKKFTDKTLYADQIALMGSESDNPDPVSLLYQTGYLTIWDYDPAARVYTLGFPNEEVKYSFLKSLMSEFIADYGSGSGKDIYTLRRYVENGDLDSIRNVLTALFAGIPYTSDKTPFEHYFQSVIYIVFTLLGQSTHCEMHTYYGRIDCVVETKRFVYIFEFKRDKSAEDALRQIDEQQYAKLYSADPRQIYCIGVNFSSETRGLEAWAVKKSTD